MGASPCLYLLASEAVELRAPVRIAQTSDFRFRPTGVDELIIADVDSNVRNARAVSVREEYQIADFRRRYR